MCRQITCRRRQSWPFRHDPRSSSATTAPSSRWIRSQAQWRSSTLPGKRQPRTHSPSSPSTRISPPAPILRDWQPAHAATMRRSSHPQARHQVNAAASRAESGHGNVARAAIPTRTSATPEPATPRRRRGSGLSSAKYALDGTCDRFRRGDLSLQQVRIQVGVGKLQNCTKCRLIVVAVLRVAGFEIAEQELVELPHAAPALPFQTGGIRH